MIAFSIVAVCLLALALVLVLPGLLRGRTVSTSADAPRVGHSNIAILREQLAQVDAELASGSIDAERHHAVRAEIERRVLEEEASGEAPPRTGSGRLTALVIGVCLPLFVLVVYGVKGNLGALDPHATQSRVEAGSGIDMAQIEDMVAKLAQRLESQAAPRSDDAQRWAMLGRSYSYLRRLPEAERAYRRAIVLAPDDAQLLADAADTLAVLQGRTLKGEPMKLVERALRIDPAHPKALALAGTDAFDRHDFAAAASYWSRAREAVPAESEFARSLEGSIAEARAAGRDGLPAGASKPATSASPRISGRVRLSPALASRATPSDTVFIFARAAEGPRMPLAILRRTVADLPISFTLDDHLAMSPQMKLSDFPVVVVGARVSKSGNATAQPGDLQGQVPAIKLGASDVELVIDSVQP